MINYAETNEDGRVAIWLDGERKTVSAIRKGAVNEHIAKAWLLKRGYEVFANISPEGPADLVAVNFEKRETLYIDVKSQSFSFDGENGERYLDRSRKFGIRYLVVDDDGVCRWCDDDIAANDNVGLAGRTVTRFEFKGSLPSGSVRWRRTCSAGGTFITIHRTAGWLADLEDKHGKLPETANVMNENTGEIVPIYRVPRKGDLNPWDGELPEGYGMFGESVIADAPDWLSEATKTHLKIKEEI